MVKSREQQIQFIRDCLFSDVCLGIDPVYVCDGWKDYVDGDLALVENWEGLKERFGLERYVERDWREEVKKYRFLASKYYGEEVKV